VVTGGAKRSTPLSRPRQLRQSAAGLKVEQARQFVKDNARLVELDPIKQEPDLLRRVIPQYEAIV
jgi:hypothetical protein